MLIGGWNASALSIIVIRCVRGRRFTVHKDHGRRDQQKQKGSAFSALRQRLLIARHHLPPTMRRATTVAVILSSCLASQDGVLAFAPPSSLSTAHLTTSRCARTLLCAVELKPEPVGGDELKRVTLTSSLLPGSRLKNLGPDNEGEGIYKFWLSAKADGKEIKMLRDQTEKEASKKANFPGFRKGQVPPYAQVKMTGFAVQEAIIKSCEFESTTNFLR